DDIGYPLIFGSLLCGWVAGVTGFVLVRVAWRFHVISRWRERKTRRRLEKAAASEMQTVDGVEVRSPSSRNPG
ncbi:MAG: DUF2062 domain-containing protein, partial [Pseudomonadota bacterium]